MLSRDLGSRCTVSAVALTLCVLGWLMLAAGPASAALSHSYLSQLTGFGDPTAVAFDASGDVYVVDTADKTVDRFSSSGTPPVFSPLAFSASGEYIVGAKLTGTPTGAGGTLVSFEGPDGVAVNEASTGAGAGDVYVADGAAHVVDVFSSAGQYLSQITEVPASAPIHGPFKDPQGLTVDQSTHDLYVTDPQSEVVDVFSSTGAYVSQFGAGVLGGSYGESVALNDLSEDAYVGDSGSDTVDVFGSSGSLVPPEWHGAGTPDGSFGGGYVYVGLDPTTHHVYVAATVFQAVDEFGASASEEYLGQVTGTPTGENGALVPFTRPQAIAVDPTDGDLYVADESGVVDLFGPDVVIPDVSTEAPTSLTPGGATLNGTVNPDETSVTECKFEYGTSTSYGHSEACSKTVPFTGNSAKPVSAELTGLVRYGTAYHYRLVATNANGTSYGNDERLLATGNPGSNLFQLQFNGSETEAGSFSVSALAVNASGDVFVASSQGSGVVDEFNASGSGKPLVEFKGSETPEKSFEPAGIAVNASGDLFVADQTQGVVDEFNAAGKYVSQFNGSETNSEKKDRFPFEPSAVAVNSSGDVYVADGSGNEVIDEFNPTGTGPPIAEFTGNSEVSITFPMALAVDASGDVFVAYVNGVSEFAPSGKLLNSINGSETPQGAFESFAILGLAVAPNGEIYITDRRRQNNVEVEVVVDRFSATGNYISQFDGSETPEESFEAGALAVNASEEVYVGSGEVVDLFSTTPVLRPSAVISTVTGVSAHSATVEGEVNPNGFETKYHVEYSSNGGPWVSSEEEASAGKGTSEVPVSQTISGLNGHTTYQVRLVAVNRVGPSTSGEVPFLTLVSPARVSGTGATDITASEATLHATIYPEGQPTASYRFEYGPTAAYGTTVPAGEGNVDSGVPTPVAQMLTGLAPDTTYHFRVVASNGIESPTTTTDQTFTTFSSGEAAGGCPNEQVRKESAINPETGKPFSMQLPECRAYEMVSPPLKNGASFTSAVSQGIGAGSIVSRVGLEGSTILVNSTGIWPDKEEQPANNDLAATSAAEGVRYKLTRGESGWGFKSEVPSASDLHAYIPFIVPNGADMSPNGVWSGGGFAPTESTITANTLFSNLEGNLYLLEPDGALAEVGPSVPLSDLGAKVEGAGEVQSDGASTDLSRVLFSVGDFRWPFDQTEVAPSNPGIYSLYEYAGTGHTGEGSSGVPTLVGVDNTGALISQCGTEPGESLIGKVHPKRPEARAISSGGSTVFFTAVAAGAECHVSSSTGEGTGPEADQVFARVGEPGAGTAVGSAVTVNVAGTSECATATFDSCNVTKAVKYQGASTDGSKVFFTSEQPLVSSDTDSTSDLYECRLPGDMGASLTRVAPVNPCPEDLIQVSAGSSTAGTPGSENANVQSVAAVSADGSHVYFIAKGVLTGENAEHNSPALGKDNLYVWQEPSSSYPQGHTAFIATLPSATFADGEVQATPDGDSFVFTSSADLTPDDTSTVAQVFLYEAQHEALVRVSKGQDGFNHDGNTTTNAASIAEGGRRTISEDGSMVVFESSEALTAQVHGEPEHNVYLWRGGNVSLISDGTPAGESIRPALAGVHSAGLVGIDASGDNVFFVTEAHLVGQDIDELPNLYDARIDGGFPAPKVTECVGEACQGTLPASLAPVAPSSLSSSGAGNLTPAIKAKPKLLTRAQKLAKALKACKKDKSKRKRAECEATAHKRYGAKAKAKGKRRAKRKTRKSSSQGGKR